MSIKKRSYGINKRGAHNVGALFDGCKMVAQLLILYAFITGIFFAYMFASNLGKHGYTGNLKEIILSLILSIFWPITMIFVIKDMKRQYNERK